MPVKGSLDHEQSACFLAGQAGCPGAGKDVDFGNWWELNANLDRYDHCNPLQMTVGYNIVNDVIK